MYEIHVGLDSFQEPSAKSFSVGSLTLSVGRISIDQTPQIRQEVEREVEYYNNLGPEVDFQLRRDVRNSINRSSFLINSGTTYTRRTKVAVRVGRTKFQTVLPI